MLSDFGKTSGFDAKFDVNSDGKIGIYDVVLVAKHIGETYTTINKGINIVLETAYPDESVPNELSSKEVSYLKELGVDEVLVATSWSRVACKDPHIIAVDYKPISVSTSSQLEQEGSDFSKENVADNNPWTSWSSKYYGTSDPGEVVEWVVYQFDQPVKVNQVVLIPRVWDENRDCGINGFSMDFNFAYSDSGDTNDWHIISEYKDHLFPEQNFDGTPPTLLFDIPEQTHKYFSFGVTKLRPDCYGGYFAQLADLKFRYLQNDDGEPEEDNNPNYNWDYLDNSLKLLENANFENIALAIGGTPRWTVMNHEDSCWEAPYFSEFLDYNPYPPTKYDELEEFSHFAAAVAKRYGDKIDRLTFYNEPNYDAFWKGTVREHVLIHNYAYDKVKSIKPNLNIGAGVTSPRGTTPEKHPLSWIDNTLEYGGLKFDIYEHHFYPVDPTKSPDNQPIISDGSVVLTNPEDLFEKLKSSYPDKSIVVMNPEAGYTITNVGLANKAKYLNWTLQKYNTLQNYPGISFTGWNNFLLYIHPSWQSGLIDINCQMGYPEAQDDVEREEVVNYQINKVIRNENGDCLTPAYYAFKNSLG